MGEPDDGGRAAMRAFAVAAVALAGFAFSLTPVARYLDDTLLDVEWRGLRKFDPRPAPHDLIIVGIHPASGNAIPQPPAPSHEAIGRAPPRPPGAQPRATR